MIQSVEEDSVTISFEAPKTDGGSAIVDYTIEKHDVSSNKGWLVASGKWNAEGHYVIKNLVMDHVYEFRVSAENQAGMSECSDVSEQVVIAKTVETCSPFFTTTMENVVAVENEAICLSVGFKGQPKPTVRWYRNGREMVSDGRVRIRTTSETSQLTICSVNESDEGTITIEAVNELGSVTKNVQLTVKVPATIAALEEAEECMTFTEGETVEISYNFKGKPSAEVCWSKEKTPIVPSERVAYTQTESSATLLISNAVERDSGSYKFEIANELGKDRASIDISILPRTKPKEEEVPVEVLAVEEISGEEEALFKGRRSSCHIDVDLCKSR
ncbi:unnamed protein product, partial [Soboliphyme baturini]|uniref:Immunoglobulin I-set domain protein n=1 Tax=Soboliphyme baturini TaxID=241478 RepID=A0A183JAE1_9BILA